MSFNISETMYVRVRSDIKNPFWAVRAANTAITNAKSKLQVISYQKSSRDFNNESRVADEDVISSESQFFNNDWIDEATQKLQSFGQFFNGLETFDKEDNSNKINEYLLSDTESILRSGAEATLKACEADAIAAHLETVPKSANFTQSVDVQLTSEAIAEVLGRIKCSITLIEKVLLDHPEYASFDLKPVNIKICHDDIAKSLRAATWSIFARSGSLIGRNSDDAVVEDARALLEASATSFSKIPSAQGRYAPNPFDWINTEVVPLLDPDMKRLCAPKEKSPGQWFVKVAKPYLVLSKRLYGRLSMRTSRVL